MIAAIDRNVLQRAVSGDARAIDLLVRALRPRIERQLQRYPVSEEDRRDLLQTTLMQVVRHLPTYRADAPFATWLFRVTANEALMMMRSHRRQRARMAEGLAPEDLDRLRHTSEAELGQRADLSAARSERAAQLRKALDALTHESREVVIAHYHLDLGLQEIASRLEMSEAAVRSRMYRARAQLRAMLQGTSVAAEFLEESAPRRAA